MIRLSDDDKLLAKRVIAHLSALADGTDPGEIEAILRDIVDIGIAIRRARQKKRAEKRQ